MMKTKYRFPVYVFNAAVTISILLLALAHSSSVMAQSTALPPPPATASYAVDTTVSITSDRRARGLSDSMRGPSTQLAVMVAHESGMVGMLELDTVSKQLFPEGNGVGVTLAAGYRWGDSEGMHYGLGLATEFFPGATASAPPTVEAAMSGEAVKNKFDSNFLVIEVGWKMIDVRYMYVISDAYRGANTATVCGSLLNQPDPTDGIACYEKGNKGSRGTQLLDVDVAIPVTPQTKLVGHWGLQRVANFEQADTQDWRIGISHSRWGVEMTAEIVGAEVKTKALYLGTRSDGSVHSMDSTALVFTIAKKF